jgi:phosphatidylserine/phosphatidylglycerophosphate/cardiolipin synthase-like enzyme
MNKKIIPEIIAKIIPKIIFCLLIAVSISLFTGCVQKNTANPQTLGVVTAYEIGFSPKGNALAVILSAISKARESIYVAAYSFTSKPVSEALLKAHNQGVQVRVIADYKANSGKYSAVTFLANQGIPVRANSNYPIFHHKFMIIDGRHIETGSFNYSAAAATKNAENVLVLFDVPKMAEKYMLEWQRLWDESKEVVPRY